MFTVKATASTAQSSGPPLVGRFQCRVFEPILGAWLAQYHFDDFCSGTIQASMIPLYSLHPRQSQKVSQVLNILLFRQRNPAMRRIFIRVLLSVLLACLFVLVMSLGRFTQTQILVFATCVSLLSFSSTRVCCSLYLMVPTIITKTGRVLLAVYALQLLLEGPLTDFLLNIDIFLRICICFTKLYLKYTIGTLLEFSQFSTNINSKPVANHAF